jgi:ribosome-binding protein aMBF1 (putative translation factor)
MKCKSCSEDVDQLVKARSEGKTIKVCQDCADRLAEEAEVAQAAEGVIRGVMEYKGKR